MVQVSSNGYPYGNPQATKNNATQKAGSAGSTNKTMQTGSAGSAGSTTKKGSLDAGSVGRAGSAGSSGSTGGISHNPEAQKRINAGDISGFTLEVQNKILEYEEKKKNATNPNVKAIYQNIIDEIKSHNGFIIVI